MNTDPKTGIRQDQVVDSDLKNGLSSVLEFAAEAHRLGGNEEGRQYLLHVSRDIASGLGHPAPNPGPVTPPKRPVLSSTQTETPGTQGGLMDKDTGRTVVSAVLTLLVVLVPGVGELIAEQGGQAEVTGIVLGTWALIHGGVHLVHNALSGQ